MFGFQVLGELSGLGRAGMEIEEDGDPEGIEDFCLGVLILP